MNSNDPKHSTIGNAELETQRIQHTNPQEIHRSSTEATLTTHLSSEEGKSPASASKQEPDSKLYTAVTQISLNSAGSLGHDKQIEPSWRPSFLRPGPLVGLAALLLAFLQILASYAILAASNGDIVGDWEVQPTVYLAVFTAFGNKAMAFATIQGGIVTFWSRALKGTTLGQLHRDWVSNSDRYAFSFLF